MVKSPMVRLHTVIIVATIFSIFMLGESCAKALWLANEVECLAKQYVYLMSTNQPMAELSAEEMSRVLEKFKTYGKKGNSSSGALQLLGTPSSALSKRKRNPEEDHASETLQEGD